MEYYFSNNIKSKSLRRKQEMNLDLFNKLVNHSVLIEEINFKFFGEGTQPLSPKGMPLFEAE